MSIKQDKVVAYDLGTSGIKASIFTQEGTSFANSFVQYDTLYTGTKFHEQRPEDWWQGIVESTKMLLAKAAVQPEEIIGISISGHSLGATPISGDNRLLTEYTPIWSDMRADEEANEFFQKIDYEDWYMKTGNGFPRELYAIFKIMWCKKRQPDVYREARCFLGSKDYCNYRLTGRMCTDQSYASGSGVYSLLEGKYIDEYIAASGIDREKLPEIIHSSDVVGNLTEEASRELGLPRSVVVVCGGVDNSCMSLGAKGTANNRVYLSLGSSAYVAVIANKPVLNFQYKPYVFEHLIPGMYVSATSIFACGTSMRWVRDNICTETLEQERTHQIEDAYVEMNRWAAESKIGANRLIFNPCLGGGSCIEESPHLYGGFVGLRLGQNRGDLVRATMEGIAYNLRYALEILQKYNGGMKEMLVVGGGSKSPLWRQMFSDVMRMPIIKTNIDQDAASLGAAALAFKGTGLWNDYSRIDEIHQVLSVSQPREEMSRQYDRMYVAHRKIAHLMVEAAEILDETEL